MVIEATDKGTPSLSSTATVIVTISDTNDNKPIFTQDYKKSVLENLPVGEEIVTVKATDKDTGDNGRVTYRIASGNVDDTFSVNQVSLNLILYNNSCLLWQTLEILRVLFSISENTLPEAMCSAVILKFAFRIMFLGIMIPFV